MTKIIITPEKVQEIYNCFDCKFFTPPLMIGSGFGAPKFQLGTAICEPEGRILRCYSAKITFSNMWENRCDIPKWCPLEDKK